MTLQQVADRFPGGRWTQGGNEYTVRCPCHKDDKASLGIGVGDKGGIVMNCGAGCDRGAILGTVGLTLADLMPANGNGKHERNGIIASYRYDNEHGNLVATKHRRADKSFLWQNAEGAWTTRGLTLPLFGLPDLLRSRPGQVVCIAEGEKDVLSLRKMGVIATCNPHGASKSEQPKWTQADTDWIATHLPERKFIIFADNDEAGHRHAEVIYHALQQAGLDARYAQMEGLSKGEDITDWIGRHTTAEFQTLLTAPKEKADPFSEDDGLWEGPEFEEAEFPEPDWLAKGLIPKGMLSMIVADPKVGKSVLAHGLCIAAVTGGLWLGQAIPTTRCLYINWEDPPGLTRDRARKQMEGEPLPRGYFIKEPPFGKSLEDLRPWLIKKLRELKIGLLVVDPLAIAARWREENDPYETGVIMSNLQEVAVRCECAVVVVHHSTKSGGEWGKEVRGSGGIFGAVMSLLSIKRRADGIFDLDLINKITGDAKHSLRRDVKTLSWEITERLDADGIPMSGVQVQIEDKQATILEAIRIEPSISAPALAAVTEIPENSVRRYLRALLLEKRIVEGTPMGGGANGRPAAGYWYVPQK